MAGDSEKPSEKGEYDPNKKYRDFKWENPDDFKNGPMGDDKRHCRDCFCCLLFVCFLAGCVAVCVLGVGYGDPNLILYPYDDDEKQCGRGDYKDYKYLYFYRTTSNLQTFNTSKIANAFCVKTCPDKQYHDDNQTAYTLDCKPTSQSDGCNVKPVDYYNSSSMMERFCFPIIIKDQPKEEDYKTINQTDPVTQQNVTYIEIQALKDMKDSQQLINLSIINTDKLITWVSDLYITWPVILASLGWTFVIALIYLFFVRFCAGFIVYLTILLVLGCFIVLGYFFHDRANLYDSVDDSMYHSTMIGLGWFCYALAIIWFLVIVVLCNRIRLAANMMEVTAKYIHANCCIFFVPIFFFILTGAWYAYWVIISIYLYSTGEMKGATVIANIEWDNKTRYAWWFHLFALFYMNEFLKALAQFVYASSACIWYFSHDKGTDEKPIKTSFKRAFRYHLGSLAFGSLIVAIIRFIMFFMEYIKKKVDKTVGQKTKQGKIYRCIICCCQCCMNCVARTMEFINKHAYVQIALKGENFCKSAWEGFGIIVRNLGRFSTLFLIGGFFNLFGMIFIAASSGMIGYLLITNIDTFADKISSPVLPTFTMVMIGFVIGMVCLSVFGTSSDALMHAFLLDEEINKGQPKNFPELQKFMEDEK